MLTFLFYLLKFSLFLLIILRILKVKVTLYIQGYLIASLVILNAVIILGVEFNLCLNILQRWWDGSINYEGYVFTNLSYDNALAISISESISSILLFPLIWNSKRRHKVGIWITVLIAVNIGQVLRYIMRSPVLNTDFTGYTDFDTYNLKIEDFSSVISGDYPINDFTFIGVSVIKD